MPNDAYLCLSSKDCGDDHSGVGGDRMLSFHSGLKIFVAVEAVDLRKSFAGLWAVAQEKLKEDPNTGSMFVFGNRRRNRVKILYADRSGLWVMIKRLDAGTFSWPVSASGEESKIRLAPEALQLLLDGVDLRDGAKRAWYEQPVT